MKSLKVVIAFILGLVISGVGVYAINIEARNTAYDNTISGSSATNMQDAIDDLYEKAGNVGSGIGDALIPTLTSDTNGEITVSGNCTGAYAAFDGNDSTQWKCARGANWIQIDFGKERSLRKIDFLTKSYNSNVQTSYYVQVSNDGTTWTNASLTFVHQNGTPEWYYFYLNHDARYLRININGYVDFWGFYTIQVYGY